MATASVSHTFVPDTTIFSGQVNTNFSDLVTLLNNYDSGSSTWSNVFITSTATTPLKVSGNASSTVVSIDNTHATDGDSVLAFLLDGVEIGRLFIDDSDSDRFKINMNTRVERSASGADTLFKVANTSNTASATATMNVEVAGSTASDATFKWSITSGREWTAGIDNSTSNDDWVLSLGSTLGTTNSISINGSTNAVSIRGTNTNDSAAAGFVGEYVEGVQSSSTNFPTTSEFGDGASISLTAGDWQVSATLEADKNTATWTQVELGISSTTGNSTSGLVIGNNRLRHNFASSSTTPDRFPLAVPGVRVQPTSTTTYYAKVSSTYSAGQPQYRCRISAVRIR